MNSCNSYGDRNLPSHDYEVYISVVADVVGESKTGEQSPNQPPGPPVEVFNTTVSNVPEWLVADTLTKAGTLSYVGVEKRSPKEGGNPAVVINLEFPQEYLICYFTCSLPENPENLYLKVVGIPPPPNRTITKKVYLCNYDENNATYKDNLNVDYDGVFGPFFDAIADEKELTTTEIILCPW